VVIAAVFEVYRQKVLRPIIVPESVTMSSLEWSSSAQVVLISVEAYQQEGHQLPLLKPMERATRSAEADERSWTEAMALLSLHPGYRSAEVGKHAVHSSQC